MNGSRILVIRFSALGDVAMVVPVLRCALHQYPALSIIVVSRAAFRPLFEGLPRVHFVSADLKGTHRGFPGLFKLYTQLLPYKITAVADMHGVLRSHVLRNLFRLSLKRTAVIDKGRAEKKSLTRKENKILHPLPSSPERYARVLEELGFLVDLDNDPGELRFMECPVTLEEGLRHIGIAPFAQHKEKMYPLEKMEEVFRLLGEDSSNRIWLFGGGENETTQIAEWEQRFPHIKGVAGKYALAEELGIMRRMNVMVSMDSANMHLASLVGTRVVSIWGATHPFAGFYGWKQDPADALQIDLYCRPCSVFGNKPCYRGDHACMWGLEADVIVKKILSFEC